MAAAGLDQSLTELFLSEDRRVQVLGDLTLLSGRSFVLQPGDIAAFTVSEGVQDGLLPGACPSGCIRLTLADPEGAFLPMGKKRGASPLLGARLRLIVQVWDGTQWQSAPVGVYTLTCVSAQVRGTGCVLTGMDDLGLCFDAPFALPGSPPATLGALAAAIGAQAGVAVPGDFSGSEDPVDTLPDTLAGHTLRQVLSFVCRLAGCFACCDRTGVIRIKPARNTDEAYELLPRHILRRSFEDEHLGPVRNLRIITLGGECEEDGVFLAEPETAATKTETLQIGQDPFFPYGDARNPARAAAVLEHVRGLELMALSAEWRGDPQVMLGQPVVLRDIRGHVTKTCVTRQTLRFDRGFRMEMYCDLKNEAQSASAGVLQSGFLRAGRLSGSLIVDGSLSAHALRADSITARELSAHSIDASRLTTDLLNAGTVDADRLKAGIAELADARIGDAKIDYAKVYDLFADKALVTQGAGGDFFFDKLRVTSAQVVDLTVGRLTVKAEDGHYYRLDVDLATGSVTAVPVTVSDGEIASGQTSDGRHILETDLTVAELNTANAKMTEALINKLTAHRIDAAELFAQQATVDQLNAFDIRGNRFLRLMVDGKADGDGSGSAVSVKTGSATLTADGFDVAFNGNTAMHVDANSAIFDVDTLSAAGNVYAGNILYKTTDAMCADSAKTVITRSFTAEDAQTCIDRLPKYLAHNVTLTCTGGVGDMRFTGFTGSGTLTLTLTDVVNGRLYFNNCSCLIEVFCNNGNPPTDYLLQPTKAEFINAIDFSNCTRARVRGLGILGASRSAVTDQYTTGIGAWSSNVYVGNCLIDRTCSCFRVYQGATVYAQNVKGGLQSGTAGSGRQNYRFGCASEGGQLFLSGNYPYASNGYTDESGRGKVWIATDAATRQTQSDGSSTPLTPPAGSVTITAAGAYLADWNNPSGQASESGYDYRNWRSWSAAKPRKGYAKLSGEAHYYHGIWYFTGADLARVTALGSASKATVTLTRDTAVGADSAVPTRLYYVKNDYSGGKPGSSVYPASILNDTGLTNAGTARGGTITFTLGPEMISLLLAGTIKGFGISSAAEQSLAQYTLTGCKLSVTV